MKTVTVSLLTLLMTFPVLSEEIVVQRIQGHVSIRHGVTEAWTGVQAGDVLRPDVTIKTGRRASAVIVRRSGDGNVPARKIVLPEEVMLDISDIRDLSQEELMLKLTMEKVRASSYEWKKKELNLPNAPISHGPPKGPSQPPEPGELSVGVFQWNGAKVLYENGFYSTCALKAIDIIRRYPPLGERFENRLVVAEALEKANLHGEALQEYISLSAAENLTQGQQEMVRSRIAQLRKQSAN